MSKPTQIKTTITPETFTAQDAGIYSNAELDQFWNRHDSPITWKIDMIWKKVMISLQYLMNNTHIQDQILIIV